MTRVKIPPRPFLRDALEKMRPEINRVVSRALRDAAAGRSPAPRSTALVLLQGRDISVLRHGGVTQNRRTFELYLNGVLLDTFQDDHQAWGYASGQWLDRLIAERVARLELALGTRVMRGRRRP